MESVKAVRYQGVELTAFDVEVIDASELAKDLHVEAAFNIRSKKQIILL